MTGFTAGFRPDSTEIDRNARPEPTGFPYRGEPAVGENRSVGSEGAKRVHPAHIAPTRACASKSGAKAVSRPSARAKDFGIRIPCGARRRRDGQPCTALSVPGKRRCKWHGGCSTGPRTPEGMAKVAANLPRRVAGLSRAHEGRAKPECSFPTSRARARGKLE